MNTSSTFKTWSASPIYSKFDIVHGVNATDTAFYYSLKNGNQANNPVSHYDFSITSVSRSNEVATVNFTKTGSGPSFCPGSCVNITGVPSPYTDFNYTGMVIKATDTSIQFISAGYDIAQTSTNGGVTTYLSPIWTTGFFFVPSYTTSVDSQQAVITAQFEPGYEQRQSSSLNGNTDTWSLTFSDRSNKETRAIKHFIQDKAGVGYFNVNIPVSDLCNDPSLKFVGTAPKISQKSFGLNDISVTVKQVFDI